jgi:hypothetical protein
VLSFELGPELIAEREPKTQHSELRTPSPKRSSPGLSILKSEVKASDLK